MKRKWTAIVLGLHASCVLAEPVPMKPIVEDARSHLSAGFLDAGMAVSNMELLVSLPPVAGFTNPHYEEGKTVPQGPAWKKRGPAAGNAFANSDFAFFGHYAAMGSFHGFNIYDVSDLKSVKVVASVVCPGGGNDISVWGDLLFISIDEPRSRIDCGVGSAEDAVSKERFRGVRVFDISDLKNIRQVATVQTCRGSHTNTPVLDSRDPTALYLYSQGIDPVRPAAELPGCSGKSADEDARTSLFSIDIIKVPLKDPARAAVIASPRVFTDEKTGSIDGLWKGGDHGPGTQTTLATDQCHDITLYPEKNLAAGGCSGNGILLDISNPLDPRRLDAVADAGFNYWHSAIFSNDASKVLYTDEWGSGGLAVCRLKDPGNWGGDLIYDIAGGKLTPKAYYKMPAAQGESENCTGHNGGLIPIPGRDVFAQGWHQGGISVVDFTDSAHPFEIAYFDRGPVDPQQNFYAGHWTAYWWNGAIYGSEIARGLDILKLKPSPYLTANEIAAAELIHQDQYNPQTQTMYVWPDVPVVAEAYIDQLERQRSLTPPRITELRKALRAKRGTARATALAARLDKQATQVLGKTAERLAGIARVLRAKT